jgi:hypothetical protein
MDEGNGTQRNRENNGKKEKKEAYKLAASRMKGSAIWRGYSWLFAAMAVGYMLNEVFITSEFKGPMKLSLFMAYLFSVGGSFTLSKTLRDREVATEVRELRIADGEGKQRVKRLLQVADSSQGWMVWCWLSLAISTVCTEWMIWSMESTTFEKKRLCVAAHLLLLSASVTLAKQVRDEEEATELEKKVE